MMGEKQPELVDEIYRRLREYYSPVECAQWAGSPHPQLDGESPIRVMLRGECEKVIAILDRLDAGGYL